MTSKNLATDFEVESNRPTRSCSIRDHVRHKAQQMRRPVPPTDYEIGEEMKTKKTEPIVEAETVKSIEIDGETHGGPSQSLRALNDRRRLMLSQSQRPPHGSVGRGSRRRENNTKKKPKPIQSAKEPKRTAAAKKKQLERRRESSIFFKQKLTASSSYSFTYRYRWLRISTGLAIIISR